MRKPCSLCHINEINQVSFFPQALYSRVLVDEVTKESIPRPQSLEKLRGPNGLSSSEVVIMDARTLMIKDFNFGGLAPGTTRHFLKIQLTPRLNQTKLSISS